MTKPEEFLFTGKCTGSSQESSPCWATPAAPSQSTRSSSPRRKPVSLQSKRSLAVQTQTGTCGSGFASRAENRQLLIVLCHTVAAFRWKERDSHTGLQAALWERENSRRRQTERVGIAAEGLLLHRHTRYPRWPSPGLWAASPRPQALPDKAGTARAALRQPWPVLPAASRLKCVPQAKF